MGYEICFHYKEQSEEDRSVYSDDIKTRSIKVGTYEDDLPRDAAAAKIFAQFARRNILVVDVEIYEYSKKKLAFKETDDGFIIGNKKFRFDDGPNVSGNVVDESDVQQQLLELLKNNPGLLNQRSQQQYQSHIMPPSISLALPPEAMVGGSEVYPEVSQNAGPTLINDASAAPPTLPGNMHNAQPKPVKQLMIQHPHQNLRPNRHEVYDPPPELLQLARQHKLPFTPKKRYPIYSEKNGRNAYDGMIYCTVDDTGQKRDISDRYFTGVQAPLLNEGQFIEDKSRYVGDSGEDPRLVCDNVIDEDIIDIRRK